MKRGCIAEPTATGNGTAKTPGQKRFTENYTGDAREDEINDNLGLVHDGLQRIKGQATEMGSRLDENMEKEAHVMGRTDAETVRIAAAEARARALIPGGARTSSPNYKVTKV